MVQRFEFLKGAILGLQSSSNKDYNLFGYSHYPCVRFGANRLSCLGEIVAQTNKQILSIFN